MASKLLIDGSQIDQTKVALVSDFGLEDFEFESNSQKHLKGNIYLPSNLARAIGTPSLVIKASL
mgnify:CR=1 FL=1